MDREFADFSHHTSPRPSVSTTARKKGRNLTHSILVFFTHMLRYMCCVYVIFLRLFRLEIWFVRHVFSSMSSCEQYGTTECLCRGKPSVYTVVLGRRRGAKRSSRVYNNFLAYVAQLHDYWTALKHPTYTKHCTYSTLIRLGT